MDKQAKSLLSLFKTLGLAILAFLILGLVFNVFSDIKDIPEIPVSQVATDVSAGKIKELVVKGETIQILYTDGREATAMRESDVGLTESLKNQGLTTEQLSKISIKFDNTKTFGDWAGTLLPIILPIIFILVFFFMMFRQVQGVNNRAMSFGQSGARQWEKGKKEKITFNDVAGVKEAKQELLEVVQFLKEPKKFLAVGARIPRGVLLVGSPGTGKTLLAKAVAGEANAPFYHLSGSEFVEMFVGVGASRVRDLFAKAKKTAPAIIFIDEIDAVGRQRGSGLGGSHDEREQTLNQILVEMDGFETDVNVIILAATNRPDVLDPALLRPGRFDRQVVLDMPDIKDREEILAIHAKDKKLAKDISLRQIAERTPGFAGADLMNLLNEAAIMTAREDRTEVTQLDCLSSIEKVMMGPERKSRVFSEHEKEILAYHETAHALVAHRLHKSDTVQKISIISRGQAAGYTIKMPSEDKHLHTKSEFEADLAVMLAGHAVESLYFKDVSTGAASDLQQATKLARQLVMQWGMSEELGPRVFGARQEMIFLGREIHEQRDYSEKVAEQIDKEVSKFINLAYERAKEIIMSQREMMDKIATALKVKETLERDEFLKVVEG